MTTPTMRASSTEAAPGPAAPVLQLRGLEKHYGGTVAVSDVNLEVAEGEFVTLLGPSGCGKTTTLRMIAGLLEPSAGQILLDGQDVSRVPARLRRTNLVFQDYALFPHLTVLENVAFGLRAKRVSGTEARARALEMLRVVQMQQRADTHPTQLSGGQQQRVALARALVNRPRVLLLDEPLGALDLKLRREMQVELKGIQDTLGIAFVHVTHDQEEALALSDRIVIMRDSRIEQVGTPVELYDRPRTAYVASFLGSSNLIRATATADGRATTAGGHEFPLGRSPAAARERIVVCVRPEQMLLSATRPETPPALPATVVEPIFQGSHAKVACTLDSGERVTAQLRRDDPALDLAPGAPVFVSWDPERVWALAEQAGTPS